MVSGTHDRSVLALKSFSGPPVELGVFVLPFRSENREFPKVKDTIYPNPRLHDFNLEQNTNNRSTSAITYRVALVFCFCNKWVLF